jgi:hypothetical protein
MAHHKRRVMAERLAQKLQAGIVWDRGQGIWDTGRRAMEEATGTWHLVIQDDAIVSRYLTQAVAAMVPHIPPDAMLSLYFPEHKHIEMPDFTPTGRWTVAHRLIGGVAVVYPTHLIPDIITEAETRDIASYDSRIFWEVWYPQPSLVEHGTTKSLRRGPPRRHALNFIGRARSGLEIEWSDGRPDNP